MTLRTRPSVEDLVEALPFVQSVDMMLLEGASPTDVARFIQDDQKVLVDVSLAALGTALARRRKKLKQVAVEQSAEQTRKWFETTVFPPEEDEDLDSDDEDGGDVPSSVSLPKIPADSERSARTPTAFARQIYERSIKDGIEELVELEALYRTARARIDRLVTVEEASNGYIENLFREITVGSDLLMKRVAVKKQMGLIDGDDKFREQLDLTGFSQKTVKVLSKPESRHRVVSLMDRLRQIEERKQRQAEERQEPKREPGH